MATTVQSPTRPAPIKISKPIIGFAIISVVLVALFVATMGNSPAATSERTSPAAVSNEVPVAQSSGRSSNQVRVQDILLTVQSVRSTWDGLPAPEPWLKYVVIEISAKNVGSSDVPRGPDDGFLVDSDGVQNKVWGGGFFNHWEPAVPKAGQESKGIFLFKIPKESKPIKFLFVEERGPGGTIPIS